MASHGQDPRDIAPVSGRLLALDDEATVRELIAQAGWRAGYQVTATDSVEAFLRRHATQQPDLIVLDLTLDGSDGVEVLEYLAAQEEQARILLLSSADSRVLHATHHLIECLGLNALPPMRKPVRASEMVTAFRAVPPVDTLRVIELDRALAGGEIQVVYQPKVCLTDGRVAGVEALARWHHPERGPLPPDTFIKLAEKSGRITALTLRVLAAAALDLKPWLDQGPHALALNISIRSLQEPGFAETLIQHVARAGLSPWQVTLEVTESLAMRDEARVLGQLTRLRLAGFSLSLDDFGTGYASLTTLYNLPFSEVKIDRSFVAGLDHDREAEAIVATALDLARRLELHTVAEGIETASVAGHLIRLGCDLGQGYLYAKPMSVGPFRHWAETEEDTATAAE